MYVWMPLYNWSISRLPFDSVEPLAIRLRKTAQKVKKKKKNIIYICSQITITEGPLQAGLSVALLGYVWLGYAAAGIPRIVTQPVVRYLLT